MKMKFGLFVLLLVFPAIVTFAFASPPAQADTMKAIHKRAVLTDAHREMFAASDFSRLDAGLNKIQLEYEKGQWTDVELWELFTRPLEVTDPAFENPYTKWVEAYPKSYAALHARGAYYHRRALQYTGKPDKAADMNRFVLQSFKDNVAALSLTAKPLLTYGALMQLYVFTGDRKEIKNMFDQAIKLAPRSILARNQYMVVLNQTGAIAEMQALAENMRGLSQDEDDISAAIAVFHVRLFREARYGELDKALNQAQKNYETGKISDETLEEYFSSFYSTYAAAEAKLDAWVKAYPSSYAARQGRCSYFLRTALAARGTKFIKDTSPEELAGLELYLKRARADCTAAAAMVKKPILAYKNLLYIAQLGGDQKTRKQMLDFANIVDPKNSVVRAQYMFGLQAKWGGSLQQMRDFLEQAKLAGVSERGIKVLNDFVLDELRCDVCNGTKDFEKIGTLVTGF